MKVKIEWKGPEGYNPVVGLAKLGSVYEVDKKDADRLIENKVAELFVQKKSSKKDKE